MPQDKALTIKPRRARAESAAVTTSHGEELHAGVRTVSVNPLAKTVDQFRTRVAEQEEDQVKFETRKWRRTYEMIAQAAEMMWPYVYGDAAEKAVLAALYEDAQINAPNDAENPCHAACVLLWGRFDPEERISHHGQEKRKFVRNPSANKYAHALRRAYEEGIPPNGIADWIEGYPEKLLGIERADQKAHPYTRAGTAMPRAVEQHIKQRLASLPDLGPAGAQLKAAVERAQLDSAEFVRAVLVKDSSGEWSIFGVVPKSQKAAQGDLQRIARLDLKGRSKQESAIQKPKGKRASAAKSSDKGKTSKDTAGRRKVSPRNAAP